MAEKANEKYKDNFDKFTFTHTFLIMGLVCYKDFTPLSKNPKLTPQWLGPAKITEVDDTNAQIVLPYGKTKIINVMHLKKKTPVKQSDNTVPDASTPDLDFNSKTK